MKQRLRPEIFNLPVEKMRDGYYSDTYFNRARAVLQANGFHPVVRMQVFQRSDAVLCGIDEALAILRLCSGRRRNDGSWEDGWDKLNVHALHDGDRVTPYETVLTIEGDYGLFAHLETCYLGVLTRRTRIATNAREIVDAADGNQVLFFPARFDHHLVQTGDGYAAYISGALGVSTDPNAEWWGARGMGTVPHALIAAYGGDTVLATKKFCEFADSGRQRVNPQLVFNVRRALDAEGFSHVRIVVSGGFTRGKIRAFESARVPVDAYAVGSAFFAGSGSYDFTADIVAARTGEMWEPANKAGRPERPNPMLETVA